MTIYSGNRTRSILAVMASILRKGGKLLVGIGLLAALSGSASGAELTVYIWEDYISEEVVAKFEATTGNKINQVYFDSDKIRDEIVSSPRGKQFDIVLFDNIAVQIFGKNNRLLAINRAEVPNTSHIDKKWQESCGNFGVPYFYGTLGIVYDTTRYPKPPESWKDLLQPAKEHWGKVVMMEDMNDTIIPALLYRGYSINSENEKELKEAYNVLLEQMPVVLNYKYALSNIKAHGEEQQIDIALAFSGDQYTMNEASGTSNWAYVIPREGTAVWIDCLSITSWTTKRKEAAQFLNFLSDPQMAAKNSEDIYYSTPISGAKAHMSKEAANDPELFPPESVMQKGQLYRILSDNSMRQRGRIVDAILKKHEAQ